MILSLRPSILIISSLSLSISFALAAKCYYPDGSAVPEDDYQPCALISGIDSMCCATNRDAFPDTCLANGLCHNPCKTTEDCSNIPGKYWRESCTDPTWKSPYCLKEVCTNDDEGGSANGTSILSQCATDGHWCCGDLSSAACCALDNRFFLPAALSISSPTSKTLIKSTSSTSNQAAANSQISSAAISSSTPIPPSTSTSTSTSTPGPSSSHSQTGKSAGLGAGIGIGVLAIGIVVFWFVARQRKRHRRTRESQYQRPVELDHDDMVSGMPKYGSNDGTQLAQLGTEPMLATAEMDGVSRQEIDGTCRQEIDGASRHGRQVNGLR